MLAPGDEPALGRFCAAHPHTTLFFQNNVVTAGLVDRGAPYQGTYVAAFDGAAIVALAAHYWQGNVIVEAPVALEAVVGAAVAASGRAVSGLLGPWAQVCSARNALGLEDVAAYLDSADDLFALDLAALRVPEPLARGGVTSRRPLEAEVPMLVAWRRDYRTLYLQERDDDALLAKCRDEIHRLHHQQHHFVLERDGDVVAYSAYNAATPSCVQIGGVWTPPGLRGRGFARAVVAGSLLAARELGVSLSVLFTQVDNHSAKAAYRALGYERIGDYGMVMLSAPR